MLPSHKFSAFLALLALFSCAGCGHFGDFAGLSPAEPDDSDPQDNIKTFWAELPDAWKQRIADDPNADFYDPCGQIDSIEKVQLGDDYDGDGRCNLCEYLDETDPTDFFNGAPARIRALQGDAQTSVPGALMASPLIVSVTDAAGAKLNGAPVRFVVNEGGHQLAVSPQDPDRYQAITLTNANGGTSVAFEALGSPGTSTVTASLPNGESLTFTLYTVAAVAKARQGVTNFVKVDNGDGTATFTWRAGPAEGDFFKLQTLRPDGTWRVYYETTYGSAELPLSPGQTRFSLTVPNEE